MAPKKHARDTTETLQDVLDRPWCYYCNRDFNDQRILLDHMKAKHFKCECNCNRRLTTAGGLRIHMSQVHKQTLTRIANALPERDSGYPEIFAMEGIPEDLIKQRRDIITREYYKMAAEKRIASGTEVSTSTSSDQPSAAKKPKYKEETSEEIKARVQARIAEVKARKAAEKAGTVAGSGPASSVATPTTTATMENAATEQTASPAADSDFEVLNKSSNAPEQRDAGDANLVGNGSLNAPADSTNSWESSTKPQPQGSTYGQPAYNQPPPVYNAGYPPYGRGAQQMQPLPNYGGNSMYGQPTDVHGLPGYPAGTLPQPTPVLPGLYHPNNHNMLPAGFSPPVTQQAPGYPPSFNQYPGAAQNGAVAMTGGSGQSHHGVLPSNSGGAIDADLAALMDQAEQVAKSDEYRAKMEALELANSKTEASLAHDSPMQGQKEEVLQLNKAAVFAGAKRWAVNQGKTIGPWVTVEVSTRAAQDRDSKTSWEESRANTTKYHVDLTAAGPATTTGPVTDARTGPVESPIRTPVDLG